MKLRKEVIHMAEANRYEVILSINGKHTPIAAWEDVRSGELTVELVRYAYKQIVCWLSDNTAKKERSGTNQPYCTEHQVPLVSRKSRFNSSMYWACPHKNEDGTYCKYRPNTS